mmetsp:Transcript_93264/g.266652  ORF Transcript_93264/g.266652 Transcript_93264/m.266652 type:complete len:209 (+) Transcript_93264:100-726(+)
MASYDASRLVDHIHNWPRYAWGEGHLVYTTNVFGFQYDNVDAGYVKGVLSLPALLLTVAVFLIISSSIFCMCRGLACVCMCCYNACGHGKSRTKGNRRHGDTDAGQSEGLMNSAYVERNSEDPYFVPDDHSTVSTNHATVHLATSLLYIAPTPPNPPNLPVRQNWIRGFDRPCHRLGCIGHVLAHWKRRCGHRCEAYRPCSDDANWPG